MILLDGKYIAAQSRAELKAKVSALVAEGHRAPCLGIVIVGHNPASETYVANKMKACTEAAIEVRKIALEEQVSESELLSCVAQLNKDASIDGFIVQLPLPPHINEQNVLSAIDYRKDVDGLTAENIGRTMQGLPSIVSATPRGIGELLSRYHIPTEGKHVVVIGSPVNALAIKDAAVTICSSKTPDLRDICLTADIIIVAAGSPGLLTADMVREGTTVIDSGFTRVKRDDGYRLVGDVDFASVAPKCAYITPMPGGVGPMTIAGLLSNTVQAYEIHR